MKLIRFILMLILIIAIGVGIYYCVTKIGMSDSIMGGTLVKKIEKYRKAM
jgi:hypothetical protein